MIFSVPAATSGHPNPDTLSKDPASTGPRAAAKLRGTEVMLAAAGRSAGGTIAITYDVRVGTSICESALRARSSAIAQPSVGMNGTRMRKRLDGRCVNNHRIHEADAPRDPYGDQIRNR